jgi:hypothetical protein
MLLMLGLASCALSSDAAIERLFHTHETEFDTLRTIVDQESSSVSFAPNYILRAGGEPKFDHRDPAEEQLGTTKERWSQYMKLMSILGISQIIKGTA